MRGVTVYRLGTAHVLRVVAPALIVVGLVWVLASITGISGGIRVLLALVTLGVLVVSAVAVVRPPRVLTLTDEGYRVSLVRGTGVAEAEWLRVESVTVETVGAAPAMLVDLGHGDRTVVPLSLLGARQLAAQREVHERLNTANGYRPLAS